MLQLLQHDRSRYRHWISRALRADQRSLGARRPGYERHKIAEPARRGDADFVIDAKTGGLNPQRAAPACEDDRVRAQVMRAGVKPRRLAEIENLQKPAAHADRRAVIEHYNVGARRGLAAPIGVARRPFIRVVRRRGGLPFAELFAEGCDVIGKRGAGGVCPPDMAKRFAGVFGALDG
jgi:hypothetical protein